MNLHRLSGSNQSDGSRMGELLQEILSFSNEVHHGLPKQKAGLRGNAEMQTIQGASNTGRRMVE